MKFLFITLAFLLTLQLPINAYAQVTPSDQERALRNLEQTQQKQENLLKNLHQGDLST